MPKNGTGGYAEKRHTNAYKNTLIKENAYKKTNISKSHSRKRDFPKRRRLSEKELDKRFQFSRYVELANQLRDMIINANRVIPKNASSPEQWASHIQKINTVDGVPYKEIKERMNIYSTMVKSAVSKNPEYNKYTPQCFSGAAFREKFEKIADASAKQNGKGNDRPKSMYFEKDRDRTPTHKIIKM